ncbi:hypothetical protein PAXINDRAFT_21410 [Paxillus involutus ATCC 200175]|uniref:Uncharacterized protein n=1 Tax=Paxillus involutus ATCC 200175 TaxID=664439 RepID=A0A0C9TDJ3_PAXIN|nr:hypothetical protein PAXINDRAFT_21410 [Paxillus involutus ATCC 200175]
MKSKKSSWSFIRWFITKVVRSLMESPPEIEGVFTPIQSPIAIIRPVDNWPATLNIHATQASQCFVEEVVHYKHVGGKQHEFLRFKVSHPAGPWKAFVFADRTVNLDDEDGEPSLSNKAAVLSNPAPSSSSSSSAHSSRNVPAHDTIYAATASSEALDRLHVIFLKDKPRTVRTLTFDTNDTRPTVPELASLLKVTSHSAPSYSAYQNQCYWFAGTVYEALGQLFPNHIQSPDPRRNGTFRGIAIPMANSIMEVCEAYHRERAAILERANEERERYEAALRAQREEGRAEERAALEREREQYEAVLRVQREQAEEILRLREELAAQSRGAAVN